MRIFALSDIHIDYDVNARWVADLPTDEFQDDVLILAGDVSDTLRLLGWCLRVLAHRFKQVLFVPGNHDLWVIRDEGEKDSLQKFADVCGLVESSGASMNAFRAGGVSIIPLLSWYDYSFGDPSVELRSVWMDYRACRWPSGYTGTEIAAYFASVNNANPNIVTDTVITFSHFVPRIDVMPDSAHPVQKLLYPILGSTQLEQQLRGYKPRIHVYGHSHINRHVEIDGVSYINNALGYPSEMRSTFRRLLCIYQS